MSYATGADLIKRYDVRMVGDLAWDEGEEMDPGAVPDHANVAAALEDASGEIDASLITGGRYTPAQLAALTGNSLSHLKRITCAIAMAHLFERRSGGGAAEDIAEKVAKIARDNLTALRRGDNVFGVPELENGEAAVIDVETVDSIDIDNLNLLPGRMSRYFPGAETRTPRF